MQGREIIEKLEDLIKEAIKSVIERLAIEERSLYLEEPPETKGNGFYSRSLLTKYGPIEGLMVPRTRDGNFRAQILPPPRRRAGLDLGEAVLALYASGASTRAVSRFIETIYGAYYSPASISRLTEVAEDQIESWRKRRLSEEYFALYLDATFLPVRRGTVAREPVYLALGIRRDGTREIVGFWTSGGEGESALVYQEIFNELRERGLKRIEVVIGDGLSGLKEAVLRVYPGARFQRCVLHSLKYSLRKVRRSHREALAQDLRKIYRAGRRSEALEAFRAFKARWQGKYPEVVKHWEENLEDLLVFLEYPEPIRNYIYTTNQLERLIKEVKRRTKVIEVFCEPGALYKVVYLVLRGLEEKYRSRKLRGFEDLMEEGLLSCGHS
ncbi:IS256 family transposase [Thermosulfurimonas marina]|uniref:Mutator family transposase n=1 Tax=Thermosulfurimonas marina TaxID=2047767 RepID=A0A6H1WRZ2_9BACT|nr:IS256 family transposase [Thermosulfurimonas marina]